MSAHLLVFPDSLPDSYESWQGSVNKLGLKATIIKTGLIDHHIDSPLTVKFENLEDTVECLHEDILALNRNLKDLLFPTINNRDICIDFIYHSTGLAAALVLAAGLIADHKAICYMDFQGHGFIDLKEALDILNVTILLELKQS